MISNRTVKRISNSKNSEGITLDSRKQVAENFINYFKDIVNNYEHSNLTTQKKFLESIPKFIIEEDNKMLNKTFTK